VAAAGDPVTTELVRTIAERKVLELEEKLAGIGEEFDAWLADAGTGKPLRKHQTQIRRLTDQLRGMADDVGDRIDKVSVDDDEVLAACRQLQREMLEVHRLWDYYRSKLNLRYIEWFSAYLSTADEFAWACYQPVQDAAGKNGTPALRGGPLVFLSGEFSPFTDVRGKEFEVPDIPDTLNSEQFEQALAALPIPLVGVPWYQVAHLPDAVLIAHEIGHDVEKDFALSETLEAHAGPVFAALDARARFAWSLWLREFWADLYGVLAAGPAFVSATIDLLVTNPAELAADARAPLDFGTHPPAAFRIRAMTRALEQTGFGDEATDRWDAWNGTFPANGGASLAVAEGLVDALLAGTYPQLGDVRLGDVLDFSSAQQDTAAEVRDSALNDIAPQSGDIRCLVAGARLAFDKAPKLYRKPRASNVGSQKRILDRAVQAIGDQTRMRPAEAQVSAEDDRAAGRALFGRLIRGTPNQEGASDGDSAGT
jgi:hypothetical protein